MGEGGAWEGATEGGVEGQGSSTPGLLPRPPQKSRGGQWLESGEELQCLPCAQWYSSMEDMATCEADAGVGLRGVGRGQEGRALKSGRKGMGQA